MAKSYIEFKDISDRFPRASTKRYEVWNKTGQKIGDVSWYSQWRKHCFYPENGCIFDTGCLQEIVDFMRNETEKQKAK